MLSQFTTCLFNIKTRTEIVVSVQEVFGLAPPTEHVSIRSKQTCWGRAEHDPNRSRSRVVPGTCPAHPGVTRVGRANRSRSLIFGCLSSPYSLYFLLNISFFIFFFIHVIILFFKEKKIITSRHYNLYNLNTIPRIMEIRGHVCQCTHGTPPRYRGGVHIPRIGHSHICLICGVHMWVHVYNTCSQVVQLTHIMSKVVKLLTTFDINSMSEISYFVYIFLC